QHLKPANRPKARSVIARVDVASYAARDALDADAVTSEQDASVVAGDPYPDSIVVARSDVCDGNRNHFARRDIMRMVRRDGRGASNGGGGFAPRDVVDYCRVARPSIAGEGVRRPNGNGATVPDPPGAALAPVGDHREIGMDIHPRRPRVALTSTVARPFRVS